MSWRESITPPGASEGGASLFANSPFPGEQAQISDLIAAAKTHPAPESLLGLQLARDTCRVER